jgi:hypothetical protein
MAVGYNANDSMQQRIRISPVLRGNSIAWLQHESMGLSNDELANFV